eukprot:TRINITY_DN38717_c0_g1_i1.p1 TRINITY_DN38717_c0_g1~~TRINITY_DN38717_c0_g1_i1.p1  ORF type:complete len:317 (-),score=64.31 TRINITY_DN38717_c0_g1_i1:77-1027(-)
MRVCSVYLCICLFAYSLLFRCHGARRDEITLLRPFNTSEVRIFLLHLERRKDRLQKLEDVLRKQAPWMLENICMIYGPDGKEMIEQKIQPDESVVDAREWQQAVETTTKRKHTIGETHSAGSIGVAMAHGLAWEHIRNTNAPFALVMEDDVDRIHHGLRDFLGTLAAPQRGEQQWGVALLGHCAVYNDEMELTLEQGGQYCASLYAMRPDAARQALEKTFPIAKDAPQIDQVGQFFQSDPSVWHSMPPAAKQLGSEVDSDAQILGSSLVQTEASGIIKPCEPLQPEAMLFPALQLRQAHSEQPDAQKKEGSGTHHC